MKHQKLPGAILLRRGMVLVGMTLVLILVGCGPGEAVMPNPPTGVPADRSVGLVAPVPDPIPHALEGRQECFTCHALGAVDAPPVPTDHEQDVTVCTTCHAVWLAPAIAAVAPPAIPHELAGREDCLACHKLGTADAPRVPENHSGLTTDICQTCHSGVSEIVGTGEEEGTLAAEPPPIPHGLEGFGACSQCHEEGGPGIPQFPADHQGRTDDLCSACHSPAAEAAEPTPTAEVAATPIEEAEPTPTTEVVATPTEAPSAAGGDAANGQLVFTASCALCHGADGEGTAIAPNALNDPALLTQRTDEDLTTAIREGVGGRMPPFPQLSDQEVLDLLALLRSWQ